ncbi:MAG: type II toxin-antitoxin system RelE/ParE family toxin [Eubacteriaceae bacterium]
MEQKYLVLFYEKANGSEPAKEFLDTLDNKMLAKMLRTITILEKNGPSLREPYSKPLGDGIFELRAKVGSDISRVLYFFFYNRQIVLTHGFIKKQNKTPKNEIEKAKKYRNEYIERKEEKNE